MRRTTSPVFPSISSKFCGLPTLTGSRRRKRRSSGPTATARNPSPTICGQNLGIHHRFEFLGPALGRESHPIALDTVGDVQGYRVLGSHLPRLGGAVNEFPYRGLDVEAGGVASYPGGPHHLERDLVGIGPLAQIEVVAYAAITHGEEHVNPRVQARKAHARVGGDVVDYSCGWGERR